MDLKELLGEDLANQVTAKLGDNKLIINGIPKAVFEEEREKIKSHKAQIEQYEKDIKTLKESASGNESLTKQISELQRANKEVKEKFDADQLISKKSFAVKEALLAEGVADEEARNLLAVKFDTSKVDLDEQGKIKGFSEAIKHLKDNPVFKGMFGQTVMQGQQHKQGDSPDLSLGEYGTNNPFKKESLNLQKQIEITRQNPELANKLKAAAGK